MATSIVAFFFICCLPPQAFLYPAAHRCRCSVILPSCASYRVVSSWSWAQPFCSFFGCAYLVSWYGRRASAVVAAKAAAAQEEEEEEEEAVGALHRMREHFLVLPPRRNKRRRSSISSSGQSSKLVNTSGEKSWSWPSLSGNQLLLVFTVWLLLLLLPSSPCLVKGASEVTRLDGQVGYAEDGHRSSKGTDMVSELDEINGRYKVRPSGRAGEGMAGKHLEGSISPSLQDRGTSDETDGDAAVLEGDGENAGRESNTELDELKEALVQRFQGLRFGGSNIVKPFPLGSFESRQSSSDNEGDIVNFQESISSPPRVAIIPPFLEWGSQPLFAESRASLTVVNTCNSTRLKVFQPFSTDPAQFYTLGFEEEFVDPGENLSIPIVYLPQALGLADAMLIVQTSGGGFLVQAQGKGLSSPYRIQPTLLGLRATSGEKVQGTIRLYNPHGEVLRVSDVHAQLSRFPKASSSVDLNVAAAHGDPCEVTSSGVSRNGFSLSGGSNPRDPKAFHGGAAVIQMRPPGQQEIRPHVDNEIADFEFGPLEADRYSGHLYIKLSRGTEDESDDLLILPIDIQVGVVSVVDVLEFGILTKEEQSSKVDVVLYNAGSEAVKVEDIAPVVEDENIVQIDYRKGLILPPNCKTQVASVTYMGREETIPVHLVCQQQGLHRMLKVSTNSSVSPTVEVPYRALVLRERVDCDPAPGSVGFVAQRSEAADVEVGPSLPEGRATSEECFHFVNHLSVPVHLFTDLEMTAHANTNPHAAASTLHNSRRYESANGHLTGAGGVQVSILQRSDILYPLVQIGTEDKQWVQVTNPSDKHMLLQALVSSKAEASGLPSCQHDGGSNPENPGACSQGDVSDSRQLMKVACAAVSGNREGVFSFADGAKELTYLVEPHGKVTLGPLIFRPPERCLWTGLLSLWNNLTRVEWVPLRGSGGSASLTFLDGEYPIDHFQLNFSVNQATGGTADVLEEAAAQFLDSKKASVLCSQRISKKFRAKNTGNVLLDVTGVELVGGGCSLDGFEVGSCGGFSLAPGQSAQLYAFFQPDFTTGNFKRQVQLIASMGNLQIPLLASLPEHLCSQRGGRAANVERAFLCLAIMALVVVLGVFFRMLKQEMCLSGEQVLGDGTKSGTSHNKLGGAGRQSASSSILLSPHPLGVTKTNSSSAVMVSGRLKFPPVEPDVQQSKTDSPGASGPGRPSKESVKGIGRTLKGVTDNSLTATVGSPAGFEEGKSDIGSPPSSLPGLRVKIPSPAAWNAQKSNLGSPMKEASGTPSTQFKKGMVDKRSHASRADGLHAKVAPEPLEESLPAPAKHSALPKSAISTNNVVFPKQGVEREGSQQSNNQQTIILPVHSGLGSGSPAVRSPRKGSQFNNNQFRQVQSPKSQVPSLGSAVSDKDKGKRRKRRSNIGTVKHESVTKVRSGSSSPSSSPASPATPASPSRPVSPLLNSDLQSNMTVASPMGFSNGKDPGRLAHMSAIPPLAKLDVEVERRRVTGGAGSVRMKEASNLSLYGGDSLSVDVASTALREMAQAKAIDLSWSTSSGKGNPRSAATEKGSDSGEGKRAVTKDWVTVARNARIDTPVTGKDDNVSSHDRGLERRAAWADHKGHCANSGPALTQSATFPQRQSCGSERRFSSSVDDEVNGIKYSAFPPLVPASTMPPAARAPGAKIAKPYLDDARKDAGWTVKGEGAHQGSGSWGEVFGKESDVSPGRFLETNTEDQQPVYDIWGNHFGEISCCSTQQALAATPCVSEGALQSLAVPDATPSFFSSFPMPSFPSIETPVLSPSVAGPSTGFSVFSQAPDVEALCLPSALLNSPRTGSGSGSRQSLYSDIGSFGHGRNALLRHGFGGSLPGSPRRPRGPYSPPLGPSPMGHEVAPHPVPEVSNDSACSFWSGRSLQDGVITAVQS